jgi:predicted ATP-grasp superfamily ATP-dependent carboligase
VIGEHVLVAGITSRALAVSAARAGYRVTAVDAFGDLDLCAVAEVIPIRHQPGARFASLAAEAAEKVPAGMVAYTSNLENHPHAVARLGQDRRLLGNSPEVLARARNPIELMRALRRHGLATPENRATASIDVPRGPWLLKPRRSGGGHGISFWRRGQPVPRNSYLQKRVFGIPGSIAFVADGRTAVPLGLSRQLVGDARLGARGFRYCGSLLASDPDSLFPQCEELFRRASILATVVVREFGLVGLNGIDFIATGGVPYPIELNPRYSASMELVERGAGVSLFEIHAQACRGTLPGPPGPVKGVQGKAIVFARRDVTLGETSSWIDDKWLADVPRTGERIQRDHPICTVFAHAASLKACRQLLLKRAASVYRAAQWRGRRAA